MNHQNRDFSQGSMAGNILRLALPMTVAQLLNVFYSVIDRMYIGRIPEAGRLSLTGLGVAFPLLMLITAFTNLWGAGGAPLCSIAWGEGRQDRAEKILGNSFLMLIVTGLLLTVLGLLLRRPLLYLFGASDATYPYADAYLSIYLLGTVFVMISLGMNYFINLQGFGRTGMFTVLLGAGANLLLDPLFIFGLGLGVRGAALATVLSQLLSCLFVLRFLRSRRTLLRLRRENLRPDPVILRQTLGLGLSNFTMSATNSLIHTLCNNTLQAWGGDLYVGMMTVIYSVKEIVTIPITGLTASAQPVLGYNYGARRFDRVRGGIRFLTAAGLLYALLPWTAVMLAPRLFVRLFSSDPALLAIGPLSLRLYFGGFFLISLQFIGQSVFVALGCSRQAIFFSLLRKVILLTPLILLLPHLLGLGANGVFLAEPISDLLGGGACFLTMCLTLGPRLRYSAS